MKDNKDDDLMFDGLGTDDPGEKEEKHLVKLDAVTEPRYVEDEELYSDSKIAAGMKRPKWQTASTAFQEEFLTSVGRKYYQTKNERSAVIAIEKAALALEGGIVSVYPMEWVQNCMDWALKKRKDGFPIMFLALVNLINDHDRKQQFVTKWKMEHPKVVIRSSIDTREEDEDFKHLEE